MNSKASEFIEELGKDHDCVTANAAMNYHDGLRHLSDSEKKKKQDDILAHELKYDAIADTEKELGISYKDPIVGDAVTFASMAKMWESSARKNEILKERRDTLFSNELDYYLEVIEENGFEKVLVLPFDIDDGRKEKFFIYWHPDGLLLRFDTYNSTIVNGGNVYYNWETTNKDHEWDILSSHGPIEHRGDEDGDFYWCVSGNHDCREALIHNMTRLRENGNFLKVWRKQSFIWLLHYGDTKIDNYDHESITAERIAMLPQHVQDAIRGSE